MKTAIATVAAVAALTLPALAQQANTPRGEPKAATTAPTTGSPQKGTISEYDGRNAFTLKTADGKTLKHTISGSRTKITIKGAAASREALKVGMNCTVVGVTGGEATSIVCG